LGAALKLLDLSPEGQPSDLRTTLSFLQTALKNRAILFVISDFNLPDFRRELVALSRRHEVILLHAFDDWEQGRALPGGIVEAWDPETQKFSVTRHELSFHSTNLWNKAMRKRLVT
jgi:hypothetical protein